MSLLYHRLLLCCWWLLFVSLVFESVETVKVVVTNLCLPSPAEPPEGKLRWRKGAGSAISFVSHLKKETALSAWN